MAYQLVLLVHILSSTLLFGTGLGTAFHGFMAFRSRDRRAIAVVSRNVVLADWLFTTPAVIVQPVTGIWMAHEAGFALSTGWLALAIGLYVMVGACWLPVVWLQMRMSRIAGNMPPDHDLPQTYRTYERWWFVGSVRLGLASLHWGAGHLLPHDPQAGPVTWFGARGDPLPLKWSALKYGFEPTRGRTDAEEDPQA